MASSQQNQSVCARLCGTDSHKCLHFWEAVACELVATFLFVCLLLSSTISWDEKTPSVVQIALCAGLAVATLVHCFGDVSGGHINPAVTVAMLVTGKIGLLKALFYVIAQCVGAIAGAAFVRGVTPEGVRGTMGANILNPDITQVQAFGVEFVLTFVLVFTVFATVDEKNAISGSKPLAIGIAVVIAHLAGIGYTSLSINPARTLGTAVITGIFDDHWVFWAGPLAGGVSAGWLYVLPSGRRALMKSGQPNESRGQEAADDKHAEKVGTNNGVAPSSPAMYNDNKVFIVDDEIHGEAPSINMTSVTTGL
ncbi:aquaporin AQPAn.G-like [Ptychodera flava]|uniref:aquaporin AQPAn.G-like n=1 Tax=Ptychodera flava TaxID=63121 RepID=UPI00396A870A